jgi:hypothetical protein
MNLSALGQLHAALSERDVVLSYFGYLSDSVFNDLSESVRGILANDPRIGKKGRAVFSLFVEEAQNVIFYSADRIEFEEGRDAGRGGIFVSVNETESVVGSVSLIRDERVPDLRAKLERVVRLSPEEVREAYQMQLVNDLEETSKGGGLGFYEIMRKASRPFEFDFTPAGDGMQLFTLSAAV